MQVCAQYTASVYSTFFISTEYIAIIIILLLFSKKIYDLFNFQNISYDKIDLIIIYLSAIQLFLFLIRLIKNFNIFSVLISINKFSQNLMISALLMLYILGKHEKTTIIKYFLVTLLILDIIIFLIGINDKQPFDTKNNETLDHLIISVFCLILDGFIWYKSYINKKIMNNKIVENYGINKLNNIINKQEKLIGESTNNIENNGFIDSLFFQNLNNVVIIISIYFYILTTFFISYFIDFILYFSYGSNTNTNNYNYDHNKTKYKTMINNTDNTNFNNTEINENCIFNKIIENKFTFWKLIICFIFFFLKDILPYLVIFLMFFYYKLKYYQSSSF